jgi:tRNA threonylcarbamoyladenosine biosynthesis protein TsaB|tara:strand:+ start:4175 stop:4864 length:690 start_codon:yes stop_codon:yes gene_type:complete
MSIILCVDTSSSICSVSIFKSSKLITSNFTEIKKSHSKLLITLIDKSLKDSNLKLSEIDAFAVSKGPGSYTGLRIGVSTIKGLCYSLEKPLISVNTLDILAKHALTIINDTDEFFLCPMIDARRMEVYTKLIDKTFNELEADRAMILDKNSFKENLENKKLYFFGDGSYKFKKIAKHNSFYFIDNIFPTSEFMGEISNIKYENNQLENLIKFEPFYIKDFYFIKKKNNG